MIAIINICEGKAVFYKDLSSAARVLNVHKSTLTRRLLGGSIFSTGGLLVMRGEVVKSNRGGLRKNK